MFAITRSTTFIRDGNLTSQSPSLGVSPTYATVSGRFPSSAPDHCSLTALTKRRGVHFGSMTPTAAEMLESAQIAALRAAVNKGVADLDAGRGVVIPAGGLRDYLRERGRLAAERLDAKTL